MALADILNASVARTPGKQRSFEDYMAEQEAAEAAERAAQGSSSNDVQPEADEDEDEGTPHSALH